MRKRLRNVAVMSGNKVILKCIITGKPQPRIYWMKDGLLLEPQGRKLVVRTNKNGSTLKIKVTVKEPPV